MAQQLNPVGIIEGRIVNGAINNAIGLPFMPSFYNSNYTNPVQGFQNSQAAQLLGGNGQAWTNYGLNTGASALGGMAAGPVGAYIAPHLLNLLRGLGWSGQGDGRGSVFGQGGLLSFGDGQSSQGDSGFYSTPDTSIGPPNTNTPSGRQRIGSEYIPNSAVAGYMPAFNNGGNSWGFATSNNPYAAQFGGWGGSPTSTNNLQETTIGGRVVTTAR